MDADMCEGVRGNIFRMNFSDRIVSCHFWECLAAYSLFLVNAKIDLGLGHWTGVAFKLVPRAEENEYDDISIRYT